MKHQISRAFAALCVLLFVSPVFGQDDSKAPITIEEFYFQSDTSVATLAAQLGTDYLELQLLALGALRDQIDRGTVDPNSDAYVDALSTAATRGVMNISSRRVPPTELNRPEVRSGATDLLQYSDEHPYARTTLLRVLDHDPEPVVRSSAALALATIGKDPELTVSLHIGSALQREAETSRDESFIFQSLEAIEQLGSHVGMGAMHPVVRESAFSVATGGFNRLIREKAIAVLARM